MDLPGLAVILRSALRHIPEERKAAVDSLNQARGCQSNDEDDDIDNSDDDDSQ